MSVETEAFWAGEFGNEYLERNQVDWRKRIPFWQMVIQYASPASVLEVGCNAGQNLLAINAVDPDIELTGCDVNQAALLEAKKALPWCDIIECAAKDIGAFKDLPFDLIFTAGVLIHIPPEEINAVMQAIADAASKYVVAIEYDHSTEQEINYRGHSGRLWKRPYDLMYATLGLRTVWKTSLGPEQGFGEGCTAWVMEKKS